MLEFVWALPRCETMENIPLVSIVIIDYGNIKWLEDCLAELDYIDAQVLIIDNNKHNRGFSTANNLGARWAKGKNLMFLNNDTKPQLGFLKPLLGYNLCAPKILNYEGVDVDHRVGRSCDIYGWQAWEGPTFFAEGSALFIRRELFEKLGGFDEKYFMYLEDLDLCWRAQLLGYTVAEVPESKVNHYAGGTSESSRGRKGSFVTNAFRRYHGQKNQLRTLLKNYGAWALFKVLPRYFLISLCEMAYLTVTSNGKVLKAYIRAYWWNIVNLPDTLRERRKVQSTRVVSDRVIQSRMVKYSGKIETIRRIGFPQWSS
jgi:GT2 family glycosyltransferase